MKATFKIALKRIPFSDWTRDWENFDYWMEDDIPALLKNNAITVTIDGAGGTTLLDFIRTQILNHSAYAREERL